MILDRLYQLACDADMGSLTIQSLKENTKNVLDRIRVSALQNEFQPDVFIDLQSQYQVETYIDEAGKLVFAGLSSYAELLLLGILLMSSFPDKAIKSLAELYEVDSSYTKTVLVANELVGQGVDDPEVFYQLAFALFRLGRADEALEAILPSYVCNYSPRICRLYGLILKDLGQLQDAIDCMTSLAKASPPDVYCLRALSEIYVDIGVFQQGLDLLRMIPKDLIEDCDKLAESLILRTMGELDLAISLNADILVYKPDFVAAMWTQCFNFSIASCQFSDKLVALSQHFWEFATLGHLSSSKMIDTAEHHFDSRLKVGFLSSDIGEHVVSRFIVPILRNYDRNRYQIFLFSNGRRFEQKALEIVGSVDQAVSLHELDPADAYTCIQSSKLDILIETNGFTKNSGLAILANRCAPIQCHYIGYHATTGLKTIDYFLGDSITTPPELQSQFTERLVQIPSLWMAYDASIQFPKAISTSQRSCLVMGAFSQVAKINNLTLGYWAAALNLVPDSILVIKDRGLQCETTRKRIESALNESGIDSERVYLFGPVASHLDHLDSYNAIDIALDTTPWSGATTAFEALGMGVPLVAICGDTSSGRMSTSVVSAAGMSHLVAKTIDEFAGIVAELAKDYKKIRVNKLKMQKEIRSRILFDEVRICNDFFATIERLVSKSQVDNQAI